MANLANYEDGSLPGETAQMVGFLVGGEEYCLDIRKVQEIIRILPITAILNSPADVEGVISLRGRVIPVIDFRKRFGIAGGNAIAEENRRIIVFAVGEATLGLVVDGVSQVVKFTRQQIEPLPHLATGGRASAVIGVGKQEDKLMVVLDASRIFPGLDSVATQGGC